MRTSMLIDSSGTFLNTIGGVAPDVLRASPIDGSTNFSLFTDQITLEFFNGVTQQPNGLWVRDNATVVNSGLVGVIAFSAYCSEYSPYPVTIGNINIASANVLTNIGFVGVFQRLDLVISTPITGCNYINILIDRN